MGKLIKQFVKQEQDGSLFMVHFISHYCVYSVAGKVTRKFCLYYTAFKFCFCCELQDLIMQQDRLIQNRIHRAFRRAEEQLLKSLTARKGEVKASVVIFVPLLEPPMEADSI